MAVVRFTRPFYLLVDCYLSLVAIRPFFAWLARLNNLQVAAPGYEDFIKRGSRFEDMPLSPELLKGIYGMGWEVPSTIQAESLPFILDEYVGLVSLRFFLPYVRSRLLFSFPSVSFLLTQHLALSICLSFYSFSLLLFSSFSRSRSMVSPGPPRLCKPLCAL